MAGRFRGSSTPDITRVRSDGSKSKTAVTDSLEDKIKARTAKNTAYQKYKDSLNEYFDGKRELPSNLRDMLATRPGAEDHGMAEDEDAPKATKAQTTANAGNSDEAPAAKPARRRIAARGDKRALLVAALRESQSPREAEEAIDAMRAEGFSLPLEVDLLSKALGHKSEDVFTEALRGLEQVGLSPETPGAKLLKGRIANVALLASSGDTEKLCTQLQAQLVN